MKYLTFVLGAGASKAYGFPLGTELVDGILRVIEDEITAMKGSSHQYERDLQILRDKISVFDPDSIDAFIEQHYSQDYDKKKTPDIKEFISRVIFSNFNKANFGRGNPQNWMKYIFEEVHRFLKHHPTAEDLPIKIITFNYDTSLEYYFHRQISYSGFLSNEEKARFRSIFAKSLIHVHGQLGNYSWQKEWLSSFDIQGVHDNWLDNILHHPDDKSDYTQYSHYYTDRISTIGDLHNEKISAKAREWLDRSNTVLISGYSFSPENNSILNLTKVLKEKRSIVGIYKAPKKLTNYVKSMGSNNLLLFDATTYDILSEEITISSEYELP